MNKSKKMKIIAASFSGIIVTAAIIGGISYGLTSNHSSKTPNTNSSNNIELPTMNGTLSQSGNSLLNDGTLISQNNINVMSITANINTNLSNHSTDVKYTYQWYVTANSKNLQIPLTLIPNATTSSLTITADTFFFLLKNGNYTLSQLQNQELNISAKINATYQSQYKLKEIITNPIQIQYSAYWVSKNTPTYQSESSPLLLSTNSPNGTLQMSKYFGVNSNLFQVSNQWYTNSNLFGIMDNPNLQNQTININNNKMYPVSYASQGSNVGNLFDLSFSQSDFIKGNVSANSTYNFISNYKISFDNSSINYQSPVLYVSETNENIPTINPFENTTPASLNMVNYNKGYVPISVNVPTLNSLSNIQDANLNYQWYYNTTNSTTNATKLSNANLVDGTANGTITNQSTLSIQINPELFENISNWQENNGLLTNQHTIYVFCEINGTYLQNYTLNTVTSSIQPLTFSPYYYTWGSNNNVISQNYTVSSNANNNLSLQIGSTIPNLYTINSNNISLYTNNQSSTINDKILTLSSSQLSQLEGFTNSFNTSFYQINNIKYSQNNDLYSMSIPWETNFYIDGNYIILPTITSYTNSLSNAIVPLTNPILLIQNDKLCGYNMDVSGVTLPTYTTQLNASVGEASNTISGVDRASLNLPQKNTIDSSTNQLFIGNLLEANDSISLNGALTPSWINPLVQYKIAWSAYNPLLKATISLGESTINNVASNYTLPASTFRTLEANALNNLVSSSQSQSSFYLNFIIKYSIITIYNNKQYNQTAFENASSTGNSGFNFNWYMYDVAPLTSNNTTTTISTESQKITLNQLIIDDINPNSLDFSYQWVVLNGSGSNTGTLYQSYAYFNGSTTLSSVNTNVGNWQLAPDSSIINNGSPETSNTLDSYSVYNNNFSVFSNATTQEYACWVNLSIPNFNNTNTTKTISYINQNDNQYIVITNNYLANLNTQANNYMNGFPDNIDSTYSVNYFSTPNGFLPTSSGNTSDLPKGIQNILSLYNNTFLSLAAQQNAANTFMTMDTNSATVESSGMLINSSSYAAFLSNYGIVISLSSLSKLEYDLDPRWFSSSQSAGDATLLTASMYVSFDIIDYYGNVNLYNWYLNIASEPSNTNSNGEVPFMTWNSGNQVAMTTASDLISIYDAMNNLLSSN